MIRFDRRLRVVCLLVATLTVMAAGVGYGDEGFSRYVDDHGKITLPEDFRLKMVHLGSWFVPEGDASGFHDVYTEASTVEVYRATGEFPDGATLVKELRHSRAGTYTTGQEVGYATEEIKQWFVLIKDRRGRFVENPNWGDGWGWALFKPDAPSKNVSSSYQADCLGCHVPARANDWIYIEAYPTLSAAKK
jgi:hypothetical protein